MPYFVYVLKSVKNEKTYVGYTSKDPIQRLWEHNNGKNKWTSLNRPFILIYTEEFQQKKEAILREKFLKSGQGREFLKIRLC